MICHLHCVTECAQEYKHSVTEQIIRSDSTRFFPCELTILKYNYIKSTLRTKTHVQF